MKWNKYSFKTSNDSVDILSALLCDEGIEGIEVEDHKPLTEAETKGMFIDILPDVGVDDGKAVVSFYLDPEDEGAQAKLTAAQNVLDTFGGEDIERDGEGHAVLIASETADVDWINNWKEFFHPLSVGNILVKPTWEDVPVEDRDKILIEIDPGTAFGTGGHETTQLCMLQLEKYITGHLAQPNLQSAQPLLSKSEEIGQLAQPLLPKTEEIGQLAQPLLSKTEEIGQSAQPLLSKTEEIGQLAQPLLSKSEESKTSAQHIEVLDLGTGSGILGIVALKLGADHVVGTDLDDNAIVAVGENSETNGISPSDFKVICGNIIDDKAVQDEVGYEKYDIVVANILAPVIIMLVDEVARHMKPGAVFITSGIIDTKEAEVVAAFKANPEFEIIEINHLGEWVNITARRR